MPNLSQRPSIKASDLDYSLLTKILQHPGDTIYITQGTKPLFVISKIDNKQLPARKTSEQTGFKSLAGIGTGPSDLAVNHDKYI